MNLKQDKIYYVYFLINSLDDKVFYVGKGKSKRIYFHVRKSLFGKAFGNLKKYNKIRSIFRKHGKVLHVKVKENLTEKQAFGLEKIWIKKLGRKNLCNLTDGGDGGNDYWLGKHLSKQTRKKLSKAHIGVKRSLETKEKIRLGHIGLKFSVETRNKMSLKKKGKNHPLFGKHHTTESKRKNRISNLGRKHTTREKALMKISWIKRKRERRNKK